MRLVVIFPVGKEAEADSYLAFCETHNPDETPGATWYYPDAVDKWGQRVVAFLGPEGLTWNGEPYPEPDGGEVARADGVLSAAVEWPDEE